ncbi:MAG: S-adenosylmethionine decarboxylase proenzyme [Candidatus Eisenbacteria bacterium]|uniref:S-adenosylmethionine decarboxylase proenzyme n=1 Tax=Eiseniibacteriota bacterium TaxID=2212470 RepID=A0A849SIN2_UNCEI|nr:S-adenosylmethionine decarboxylase proenzyme [Candidatus Eisenbacteria bacterium]
MTGFGPHLVFDAYGCPPDRLGDLQGLYGLLDGLPERIQMTKIMPPYVFRHAGAPGMEGLSGFVLIAESHISIHTFPKRKFINVDIFSCNDFDVEDALRELTGAFSPRRVDWRLLDRGLEFPKNLGDSRQLVEQERRRVSARSMGLGVSR